MQYTIIKALLLASGLFSAISFSTVGSADDTNPKPELEEKPLLEKIVNPTIKSYLLGLSSAQVYVGSYVQSTGERLDKFFGSDVLDVAHKGSRLIVYTPFTFYDNGDFNSSVNFRAQIDLPRTNHRWKVLVSSFEGDEEQNVNSLNKTEISPSNTQNTVDSDSQNTLAGRYLFQASKNTMAYVDLGLKFINYIEPNPYIKYKVRYKKDFTESVESRSIQNLYLERDRGFAWEGQQVFDYQYKPKWLVRSQTSGTWWHDDAEVLVNQKAILFERASRVTARAYFIDGNWTLNNQDAIFNSVAVGMNWREKLYQDWLYGELEPRVAWSDSDNFNEPVYSLRLMLEMHFYK